ncbi:MAG: DUF4010 domain-containing protein, partial [Halobacteriales archaeon]|nr:DUF4010 domain-containing protein [Halobacteriales archaeon]
MFVTFFAGGLIGYGLRLEGMVVGVATAALLVSKRRLHGIAHHISDEEVMAAVQFITLAFILFPLTASITQPLDAYGLVGPKRVFDPYNILLIVVFVSAISFASFVAMRSVGARRGVEVSGLLGGLVSSEATTASLAVQARQDEFLERPAVVGALLSTSTGAVRNLAIAAFVDLSLGTARIMLPAVAVMALAGLALALLRERRVGDVPVARATIGNPFALGPAVRFAIIFALVSALAYAARVALGSWGVYASLLGALVSGGAVVASVGSLAALGQAEPTTAGIVCALACIIGAANKLLILRATNTSMYKHSAAAYAFITLLGALALGATVLASR